MVCDLYNLKRSDKTVYLKMLDIYIIMIHSTYKMRDLRHSFKKYSPIWSSIDTPFINILDMILIEFRYGINLWDFTVYPRLLQSTPI